MALSEAVATGAGFADNAGAADVLARALAFGCVLRRRPCSADRHSDDTNATAISPATPKPSSSAGVGTLRSASRTGMGQRRRQRSKPRTKAMKRSFRPFVATGESNAETDGALARGAGNWICGMSPRDEREPSESV